MSIFSVSILHAARGQSSIALAPLLESPQEPVILSEAKNPRISSEAPQIFPVTIEAPTLCGRFTAQVLRNVTITPSIGQIAARLFRALGLRDGAHWQILNDR